MFGLFNRRKKIITEMEEWLAHPNEMGRKPDFSEIVFEGTIYNPAGGKDAPVALVFYRYLSDRSEGIGMVGPLTWSFLEFEIKGMTYPGILAVYEGWLVCFHCRNVIEQVKTTDEEVASITEILKRDGLTVSIADANSFLIHRTTNANGASWLTIPVVKEGVEEWVSFIYRSGDEEITIMPLLIGTGKNTSGAIMHYAFVGSLMSFHRSQGTVR